ncbi:MAG: UDP-3-O-(3-hydroxymyristoyl)glucosamine N-acyltransferase [Pyrinomonadaceae bacterium]
MKLSELADATRTRIESGDPDQEITAAAGLDVAAPGQITFLANPKYTKDVPSTKASAIFVNETANVAHPDITIVRAKDAYLAYTRALRLFHPDTKVDATIHPTAVIDPTARIADDVFIGPGVVIGRNVAIESGVQIHANAVIYDDTQIGADCRIYSGVALRAATILGQRVIIHNNTVVGSDGFGYAKDEDGHWLKIPQTGRVVLEDDVEIGAGTTIDCASVGETRIGRGTKIDNMVQIGHSCTIGEDTLLCSQVGLAGSTTIGNRVILAGQVGVAGHLTVGDDAVLMAGAGTFKSVEPGKILSGGIPAFDHRESLKTMAAIRNLVNLQKTVRDLERRLAEVEGREV